MALDGDQKGDEGKDIYLRYALINTEVLKTVLNGQCRLQGLLVQACNIGEGDRISRSKFRIKSSARSAD